MKILLMDSAHLQEIDAYHANKHGFSKHKPALPLYTVADAEAALKLLVPVAFNSELNVDGIKITWWPASHILGSSIMKVNISNGGASKRIVFSGNLGRYTSEIMKPPYPVKSADILVMESTYGNRLHDEIRSMIISSV